jgi:hypothetical protein
VKPTPQELKMARRFEAGVISADGFLGDDDRHVHDIVRADEETLTALGHTPEEVADRMQYFADEAFPVYDGEVVLEGHYRVENRSERGKMVCPFSHPGAYAKGIVTLTNETNGLTVKWTPLLVHMIRTHHFFEGRGSSHRVEPELLIRALFE